MSRIPGVVVWRGHGIGHIPIVAIMTFKSKNPKTGDTPQVWILLEGINPVKARYSGADEAVCGSCVHRHYLGGACYVNVYQAPNNIYKAYRRGNYPDYDPTLHAHLLKDRTIRWGAYGDPALIPIEVAKPLMDLAKSNVAYTHLWKIEDPWKGIAMASCDNENDYHLAKILDWRTFTVRKPTEPILGKLCRAEAKGVLCQNCKLCNGKSADISITVHGRRQKRFQGDAIT